MSEGFDVVGRTHLLALAVAALVVACSEDAPSSIPATTVTTTDALATTVPPSTTPPTEPPVSEPTTTAPPVSEPTTTVPPVTAPSTTAPSTTAPPPSTVVPGLTQPAVWPGPEGSFDTPEAAAVDFVEHAFGVEALLGEFMQGDSMSGEIEVLSPLDDDDPATTAPTGVTLLVRRVLPHGGWFVIAAVSEGVTIDLPLAGAPVAAGPVLVSGVGRGFEGTVVVRAFVAGDRTAEIDVEIAGTDWQTPVPYMVTLDLSSALPGQMIAIVASGDTGIASTGEFTAIPIVIAG